MHLRALLVDLTDRHIAAWEEEVAAEGVAHHRGDLALPEETTTDGH